MKAPLVECVPNFSEGRRPAVMEAIADAIRRTEGVKLLDWSSDPNHNRMVTTFIGAPKAVCQAALESARKAVELIDLNQHTGEHPRIGAVDVIPIVPLSGITLEECALLARELGQQIFTQLKVPIYFYEASAKRPERKNVADIRKGNFEGLQDEIANPERHPDIGPPKLHPTAGAVIVGARQFLVAFNVNLKTGDLQIAKAIAERVRESGGGLKNVRALGMMLFDRNIAQISMNLTNCEETPIHSALEAVRQEAKKFGVEVLETELIGLVPMKYLVESAVSSLNLRSFSKNQVLENHLDVC